MAKNEPIEGAESRFPGNFPFPEVTKDLPEDEKKLRNRVRATSYRKANAVIAMAYGVFFDKLEAEGTASFAFSDVSDIAKEARAFLKARAAQGTGRPAGIRVPKVTLDVKVRDFFLDVANQTDKDGNETPGKIAGVNVYIHLDMDPVRTAAALKKNLDNAEPADRLWVTYDSEARVWTIEGTGPDAPAGWTGPLPSPKKEKDLSNV